MKNSCQAHKVGRYILASTFVLLALSVTTFGTRRERVVSSWRPTHYDVSITLNDQLSEITQARVKISVQVLKDRVDTIDLDFGDLTIDSVKLGERDAVFNRTPALLNVQLPRNAKINDRFLITIDYHGKPKDGLVLANDKDGKASATGDNWPNRVHHWIPSLDHPSAKATVKFTVTAPARELVVANGKLDGVVNTRNTTRTWTYTEGVPIPAYCMVIAVGEYLEFKPTTLTITPLSYYVSPSDTSFALPGFAPAGPSLKFFSETVAPYPYEKLALIVGATRFGGMENSSAIVFASNVLGARNNPRISRAFNISEGLEQVIAHEIAHQWFGDSVTESTWSDLWLSEGFATYFSALFVQKYDGEEAFQFYMQRAANTYLTYEKRTRKPIHDSETEDLMELLNANNYQKGAWVLHMLRSQLGDEAFFRGVRKYYVDHKNSTADTNDLRKALEKASGTNLQPFFSRWVFGTGHPRYEVSTFVAETPAASLTLSVKQTQPENVFTDPVPIEITAGSEKKTIIVRPRKKLETVSLRFARGPISVKVDPNNTLLKEVVLNPPDKR